mgnify:CR=1 FL=1
MAPPIIVTVLPSRACASGDDPAFTQKNRRVLNYRLLDQFDKRIEKLDRRIQRLEPLASDTGDSLAKLRQLLERLREPNEVTCVRALAHDSRHHPLQVNEAVQYLANLPAHQRIVE